MLSMNCYPYIKKLPNYEELIAAVIAGLVSAHIEEDTVEVQRLEVAVQVVRQGEVLVGLMKKNDSDGFWERTVSLPPGRYKYIFLVNEYIRVFDSNNPRIVPDGKGGKANLIIMPGI